MRNSVSIALIGAAAISLTLGGCQKAGKTAGADADSVKQAIKADEAKWNKDVKAKDTEGLAGHYAEDAYFIPPGAAPAVCAGSSIPGTGPGFDGLSTSGARGGAGGLSRLFRSE